MDNKTTDPTRCPDLGCNGIIVAAPWPWMEACLTCNYQYQKARHARRVTEAA